jgi:hypothetical protein
LRVTSCFAEVTQQIHSFRASGVRPFQAACAVASEQMALRKSNGALCMKLALVSFLAILRLSVPIVSRRIAPHDYSGQAGPARELSTRSCHWGMPAFQELSSVHFSDLEQGIAFVP